MNVYNVSLNDSAEIKMLCLAVGRTWGQSKLITIEFEYNLLGDNCD